MDTLLPRNLTLPQQEVRILLEAGHLAGVLGLLGLLEVLVPLILDMVVVAVVHLVEHLLLVLEELVHPLAVVVAAERQDRLLLGPRRGLEVTGLLVEFEFGHMLEYSNV
jgi:hypothetical protein